MLKGFEIIILGFYFNESSQKLFAHCAADKTVDGHNYPHMMYCTFLGLHEVQSVPRNLESTCQPVMAILHYD
jgi:hypothetical protein